MASSDTEICNSALIKIGADTIINLDVNNKSGRLCKEQFPKLRDEMLRGHPWNFAIKRLQLAKTTNTPVFQFGSEFQLPSDNLRVITTDLEFSEEFAIEGDKFLCNASTVKIRYISNDVPISQWDTVFTEALALRIAADLAYAVQNSVTLSAQMFEALKLKLGEARSYDSQEGYSDNQVDASEWINSRI